MQEMAWAFVLLLLLLLVSIHASTLSTDSSLLNNLVANNASRFYSELVEKAQKFYTTGTDADRTAFVACATEALLRAPNEEMKATFLLPIVRRALLRVSGSLPPSFWESVQRQCPDLLLHDMELLQTLDNFSFLSPETLRALLGQMMNVSDYSFVCEAIIPTLNVDCCLYVLIEYNDLKGLFTIEQSADLNSKYRVWVDPKFYWALPEAWGSDYLAYLQALNELVVVDRSILTSCVRLSLELEMQASSIIAHMGSLMEFYSLQLCHGNPYYFEIIGQIITGLRYFSLMATCRRIMLSITRKIRLGRVAADTDSMEMLDAVEFIVSTPLNGEIRASLRQLPEFIPLNPSGVPEIPGWGQNQPELRVSALKLICEHCASVLPYAIWSNRSATLKQILHHWRIIQKHAPQGYGSGFNGMLFLLVASDGSSLQERRDAQHVLMECLRNVRPNSRTNNKNPLFYKIWSEIGILNPSTLPSYYLQDIIQCLKDFGSLLERKDSLDVVLLLRKLRHFRSLWSALTDYQRGKLVQKMSGSRILQMLMTADEHLIRTAKRVRARKPRKKDRVQRNESCRLNSAVGTPNPSLERKSVAALECESAPKNDRDVPVTYAGILKSNLVESTRDGAIPSAEINLVYSTPRPAKNAGKIITSLDSSRKPSAGENTDEFKDVPRRKQLQKYRADSNAGRGDAIITFNFYAIVGDNESLDEDDSGPLGDEAQTPKISYATGKSLERIESDDYALPEIVKGIFYQAFMNYQPGESNERLIQAIRDESVAISYYNMDTFMTRQDLCWINAAYRAWQTRFVDEGRGISALRTDLKGIVLPGNAGFSHPIFDVFSQAELNAVVNVHNYQHSVANERIVSEVLVHDKCFARIVKTENYPSFYKNASSEMVTETNRFVAWEQLPFACYLQLRNNTQLIEQYPKLYWRSLVCTFSEVRVIQLVRLLKAEGLSQSGLSATMAYILHTELRILNYLNRIKSVISSQHHDENAQTVLQEAQNGLRSISDSRRVLGLCLKCPLPSSKYARLAKQLYCFANIPLTSKFLQALPYRGVLELTEAFHITTHHRILLQLPRPEQGLSVLGLIWRLGFCAGDCRQWKLSMDNYNENEPSLNGVLSHLSNQVPLAFYDADVVNSQSTVRIIQDIWQPLIEAVVEGDDGSLAPYSVSWSAIAFFLLRDNMCPSDLGEIFGPLKLERFANGDFSSISRLLSTLGSLSEDFFRQLNNVKPADVQDDYSFRSHSLFEDSFFEEYAGPFVKLCSDFKDGTLQGESSALELFTRRRLLCNVVMTFGPALDGAKLNRIVNIPGLLSALKLDPTILSWTQQGSLWDFADGREFVITNPEIRYNLMNYQAEGLATAGFELEKFSESLCTVPLPELQKLLEACNDIDRPWAFVEKHFDHLRLALPRIPLRSWLHLFSFWWFVKRSEDVLAWYFGLIKDQLKQLDQDTLSMLAVTHRLHVLWIYVLLQKADKAMSIKLRAVYSRICEHMSDLAVQAKADLGAERSRMLVQCMATGLSKMSIGVALEWSPLSMENEAFFAANTIWLARLHLANMLSNLDGSRLQMQLADLKVMAGSLPKSELSLFLLCLDLLRVDPNELDRLPDGHDEPISVAVRKSATKLAN